MKFPIPEATNDSIIERVEEVLKIKQEAPTTDTSTLEAEIDQLVYQLYDLTEEEIELIEESVG